MKIAILTSGILPVPAVQGGAVENLIDLYLEYNNIYKLHDITVYSINNAIARKHPALSSDVNHYVYINSDSFFTKVIKKLVEVFLTNKGYYDQHIEYFIKKAAKLIRKEKFDLIIMENRPAFALHFKERQRIVYHLHNDHLNTTSRLSNELYDAAERIICVSDYISNRTNAINPGVNKALTVYNGIDTKRFQSRDIKINRATIGLSENDFIVIFSGRLVPEKGIKQLIEAMLKLKDNKNIKLLVVGSSFLGNNTGKSKFLDSLNELAKPIEQNIIFTGYVNYDIVPSYLHIADIAVVPSIWDEPFGLTCIEALAAGLPLITTNKGGIPEIISSDYARTIDVDDNCAQSLAASILELYNDATLRNEMSIAARASVSRFDKFEYAKNFFKALE